MGFLDSFIAERSKEAGGDNLMPLEKRRARDIDHVNTSLCKFAHSVRKQLTQTLSKEEDGMTALDWYALACSEDGPNLEQMEELETYTKETRDFHKGQFGEFRVMRTLEELQQEGIIDDFVTNYELPRIHKDSNPKREGKVHAREHLLSGRNMELDHLKIDALAYKKLADQEHLYLPIQIKSNSRRRSSQKFGQIQFDQAVAAGLRKKFPDLKNCFDTLSKKTQFLYIRHQFHVLRLRKNLSDGQHHATCFTSKTKSELKRELVIALQEEGKTFVAHKPIDQFSGMPMLEKLLEAGLLIGESPSR